jgi:hypothetical protein
MRSGAKVRRLCVTATLLHTGVKIATRATALLLLPHRADHVEYPDIAVAPIGAQHRRLPVRRHPTALGKGFGIAMPPPKWKNAGSELMGSPRACRSRSFGQDCGWQLSRHMLLNHLDGAGTLAQYSIENKSGSNGSSKSGRSMPTPI